MKDEALAETIPGSTLEQWGRYGRAAETLLIQQSLSDVVPSLKAGSRQQVLSKNRQFDTKIIASEKVSKKQEKQDIDSDKKKGIDESKKSTIWLTAKEW